MTQYAEHFLERLNRLDDSSSELAMQLYKNSALLKIILHEINPPESAKRVAIALARGNDSPHLVATRQGEFVTCLGKGMSTGDLYVISRERFGVFLERISMLAKRGEYIDEAVTHLAEHAPLESLITSRGANLSREDFLAVSVFHPAMKHLYLYDLKEYTSLLGEVQQTVLCAGIESETMTDMSRSYWNIFFSLGHLAALAAMFGPKGLESDVDWNESGQYPLYPPFHTGQMMNAARALFAAARMGKYALQVCEAGLTAYHSAPMWLFSTLGAAVIGRRHKNLMSRVKKMLIPAKVYLAIANEYVRKQFEPCVSAAMMALEFPEKAFEQGASAARQILYADSIAHHFPPAFRFASADEIPAELAFSYAANSLADFRTSPEYAVLLAYMVVWISRAEAEDLYLPRAMLQLKNLEWQHSQTTWLLNCDQQWFGKREGNRNLLQLPGRNDPCICGSKRKFKKCCMTSTSAGAATLNFGREKPLDLLHRPEKLSQ